MNIWNIKSESKIWNLLHQVPQLWVDGPGCGHCRPGPGWQQRSHALLPADPAAEPHCRAGEGQVQHRVDSFTLHWHAESDILVRFFICFCQFLLISSEFVIILFLKLFSSFTVFCQNFSECILTLIKSSSYFRRGNAATVSSLSNNHFPFKKYRPDFTPFAPYKNVHESGKDEIQNMDFMKHCNKSQTVCQPSTLPTLTGFCTNLGDTSSEKQGMFNCSTNSPCHV